MKHGKILSICLLSLFLFSAAMPVILSNAEFSNVAAAEPTVYKKTTFDLNGDKIDDKLLRDITRSGSLYVDAVLLYDQKISSSDRIRLDHLGVAHSEETWDLGRRVVVSFNKDRLDLITSLPGVSLVTTTETRYIMVAIVGEDFSDLAVLEQFEGSEIFWGVGCAVVRYYSGIESDIAEVGSYTVIADTTDQRFYPDVVDETDISVGSNTAHTAGTINASSMWSLGYDGAGIKVGVIDTGINDAHIGFEGRVIDAQSFVTVANGYDSDDLTTTDFDGHGTHTSGIAGAGDAAGTYVGIAKECSLYMAKVGSSATTLSVVAAINWLANTKLVKVINFSYGTSTGDSPGWDPIEIAFANAVRNKGVTCVTSAGNEGDQGFYTVGAPGHDDMIHVGGIDDSGTPVLMYYSSRGPTGDNHMKPDVLAPGYQIVSLNIGTTTGYTSKSGTSMAAPHVAGAAALLIDACQTAGYGVNPGLIKAALMNTAVPVPGTNSLIEGRGLINVGAAWTYILNAGLRDGLKLVGACNPAISPLHWWSTMHQGEVTEQYISCISSYKTNLSLELSGDVAPFVTVASPPSVWTSVVKVTYDVPVDATVGSYTGTLTFKYETEILDVVDIVLNVVASNGHNMLLNFKTTDWGVDHLYGQYMYFTEDILDNGWVVSEQLADLDSGLIDNYDMVWLPDPFDLDFPNAYMDDFSVVETYNEWTTSEKTALTNYVADGGSVFLCFNGHSEEIIDGYGTILTGTNITAINDWTTQYGITVQSTVWTGGATILVGGADSHPLMAGVEKIDHWGTSIVVSGDAVQVTELTAGSSYATCATYQHDSGGRVIVLTTNFCLDSAGYKNTYNFGGTQNDQFGRNLVRWGTAHSRMERNDINVTDSLVTLRYNFINGTETFGGYVEDPDDYQEALVWTEISPDLWEATYTMTIAGTYEFYPECGEAGIDDFDYYLHEFTTPTPLGGIGPTVVAIITGFGLAGYVLVQKFGKKQN
jgi:subtilisin family serine protease